MCRDRKFNMLNITADFGILLQRLVHRFSNGFQDWDGDLIYFRGKSRKIFFKEYIEGRHKTFGPFGQCV